MNTLTHTAEFTNNNSLNNVFIPTSNNWNSTENETNSLIETGTSGVLFYKIIGAIHNAKDMICLQSFLIQDTKIIDALLKAKQEREVKVFVVDSAEARLKNDGFEEDDHFTTKEYKKMLNETFKNNFVHRQAGNLHAKFILIDPKTNPKGYMLTANFNEKPFFENPELGVELNAAQISELFKIFVYHFWEHTTDEQTAQEQFDKVKPANKFEIPQLKHVLLTSPNSTVSNLKKTLMAAAKRANQEIAFSTFGFDIEHELSNLILDKLKSGLKVTVFCRTREKAINNNIEILAQNGAEVYAHDLIHAKSILIDQKEAYVFSANFESHGLDSGFETGLKLQNHQVEELQAIYKNWAATFPYRFVTDIKLNEINSYFSFNKSGRIEESQLKDTEIKRNERSIVRVEDLIKFFSDLKAPKTFNSKKYKIERVAKFQTLTSPYEQQETIIPGLEIVEYDRIIKKKSKKKAQKTKREQVVLLTLSKIKNTTELIDRLNDDYVGINIFAKDETK